MDLQYSNKEQRFFLDQQSTFKFAPKLMHGLLATEISDLAARLNIHTHAELIYILSGHGTITIKDNTYPITKGDVVILNAGVPHYEKTIGDEPISLICLALGQFQITGLPRNHLIPEDFPYIYRANEMETVLQMYFVNIIGELERRDPFYMEIATNAAQTLVMFIYRLISKTHDVSFVLHQNKVVGKAQLFIDEHYLEDISLEDVARECKISKSHLSHIFETVKHMTIVNYIRRKRFAVAVDLLVSTDLPINDVAKQSGFPNANYFSRVFRAEYNLTPRTYRQRISNS